MPGNRTVYVRRRPNRFLYVTVWLLVAGALEQQVRARPASGPATAHRRRCRSTRRPPRAAAGGTSRRPWSMDRARPRRSTASGPGTISSGSITRWKPSPWQRSHAPCGELNEKIRGSISGIDAPQLRQANRSEKIWRSPRFRVLDLDEAVGQLRCRLDRLGEALADALLHHQTGRRRSRCRACTSCRARSPRRAGAARRRRPPSRSPASASRLSSRPYSPLRPRTTGARTRNRVPSSWASTRSVICSSDWPWIGSPQLKQCGWPIRAQSRRR